MSRDRPIDEILNQVQDDKVCFFIFLLCNARILCSGVLLDSKKAITLYHALVLRLYHDKQTECTLYIGFTNSLDRRVEEHRNGIDKKSFTYRYNLHRLVYFERYDDVNEAIKREKQLKNWKRQWKIELIESKNPNWEELPLI